MPDAKPPPSPPPLPPDAPCGGDSPASVRQLACPKCAGDMVEGFLVEVNPVAYVGGAAVKAAVWHPGRPRERSGWLAEGTEVAVEKGRLCRVATYRCSKCGYLESYADPTPGETLG